jgi:succinate dehydrogenase/fumarate reductase-like Fe-S protein
MSDDPKLEHYKARIGTVLRGKWRRRTSRLEIAILGDCIDCLSCCRCGPLKDSKYPFCVTSALKHAYPVRTDDDGVKVCNGTPEGPIPIDSLKKYDPSEPQWK